MNSKEPKTTLKKELLIIVLIAIPVTAFLDTLVALLFRILVSSLVEGGYRNQILTREGVVSEVFPVMFLTICGIIIYSVIVYLLIKNKLNYLSEIRDCSKRIADGEFDVIIPSFGNDELTEMSDSINAMAKKAMDMVDNERLVERSKNDLITNVAHDLRTPLTSMIGYLDILRTDRVTDEEMRKKYLDIAFNKSLRLQNLIEDLFGFTKLSYGKMNIHLRQIDLVKLLEQMLDEFYLSFEKNNLTCEFVPETGAILTEADGELIARLFENLISNAIKYGSDGKLVRVEVKEENKKAIVRVINFGKIMTEEEQKHIFEKFYRTEQSRSSSTGGSGLGLAIAKEIVELHGGSIKASASLHGTVFEVELPVKMPETEASTNE